MMGCRDCYYWYRCMERSRDYPCRDYKKIPKWVEPQGNRV
nr:MAG TPA: hypothetical protein [Caudoviricetes sp.]